MPLPVKDLRYRKCAWTAVHNILKNTQWNLDAIFFSIRKSWMQLKLRALLSFDIIKICHFWFISTILSFQLSPTTVFESIIIISSYKHYTVSFWDQNTVNKMAQHVTLRVLVLNNLRIRSSQFSYGRLSALACCCWNHGKISLLKIGCPGVKISNNHADDKNFKISSSLEVLILCSNYFGFFDKLRKLQNVSL